MIISPLRVPVSSLSPGLRPGCPRNTGANAATTREGLRRPCFALNLEVLRLRVVSHLS
jgi:hypothetical protein